MYKLSQADKREVVETLGRHTFFRRCTTADLDALVEASGPFVIPPNWALMQENTPAHSCYAITKGTARVFVDRVQVAELGPGDIVGEMAVLTGDLRRATVTSTTRLRGLRVDNDRLVPLLDRRPELLGALRRAFDVRSGRFGMQPGLAPA